MQQLQKNKKKNNPKSNQLARRRKEILQKQNLNIIIRKESRRFPPRQESQKLDVLQQATR